jgi:uncharacterized membrane protein (UPF0127 family)
MLTIYQKASKLIKNIALIASISIILPMSAEAKSKFHLENPRKNIVDIRLAITREEHAQGLSGIKASNFPVNEGMLFVNEGMAERQFWMPDTYFNLDIIYMDSNLKVVAIEKNAPAHPGMFEPPVIYRAKSYPAQFILETKASSPFSKDLKIGDQLKWMSSTALSEIVLKTRQKR